MSQVPIRAIKAQHLSKAIFKSDVPEEFIRSIPAQSLFFALKHNGLFSSVDLVEIATIEQVRILVDLDCWKGDQFDEDEFWEWLALTDENNDLTLLQKILKCIDLKLLALLIGRYVQVEIFEQPNEQPPGPNYYTPDQGFTWVSVVVEDSTKHFLLNRLLALLFETNAELYYQLLSISSVSTPTLLEEEAFQDKQKRLSAEGVPDFEFAAQLHAPTSVTELANKVLQQVTRPLLQDIRIIEPIVAEEGFNDILIRLLSDIPDVEQFEAELTLLTNAALVHWRVIANDFEELRSTIEKVKGALTIGIESFQRSQPEISLIEGYNTFGLQGYYRLGVAKLAQLRRFAIRLPEETVKRVSDDVRLWSLIAGAREKIPVAPKWFLSEEEIYGEELPAGHRALRDLRSLEELERAIKEGIERTVN